MIPFVSIIIPCRNEEAFIGACLDSIRACTFPGNRREVLVIDGMSDDRTRGIVERYVAADNDITLLDNPARIVPAALNIGIRAATGDVIVRMDAHCLYPPDYLSALVDWLERSGADNVGGVCRTRPSNDTAQALAIAVGLSHPFGVGNAYFRIGASAPRWVDTVPFGCYRREIFDRIGMFDEDLVRNQDDEFNGRLRRQGGRILLVPEIVCDYFARGSLGKLWCTYFTYGRFKPLVARKLGRVMTVRQLVPAAFVVTLIVFVMLVGPLPMLRLPLFVVLSTYVGATLLCSIQAGWKRGLRCVLWLTLVFPVLHLGHGLGFLRGLVDAVTSGAQTNVPEGAVEGPR